MPNPYYIKTTTPGEALSRVADVGIRLGQLKQQARGLTLKEKEYQSRYAPGQKATLATDTTPARPAIPRGTELRRADVAERGLDIEEAKVADEVALNSSFGDRYPHVKINMAASLGVKANDLSKFAPNLVKDFDAFRADDSVTNEQAYQFLNNNYEVYAKNMSENISKELEKGDYSPAQVAKMQGLSAALKEAPKEAVLSTIFPAVHPAMQRKEALASGKGLKYRELGGDIYGLQAGEATLVKKGDINTRAVTNAMKDPNWRFADEAEQAQLIEKHKRFVTGITKKKTAPKGYGKSEHPEGTTAKNKQGVKIITKNGMWVAQ